MLDRTTTLPLDTTGATLAERIAALAFSRGCSVRFSHRFTNTFAGPYILKLRIRLNGKLCVLHHYHRDPGERLAIERIPRAFAHILESGDGTRVAYYVIPDVVLGIRFGSAWRSHDLTLCQPFWRPYLDAWHVLK